MPPVRARPSHSVPSAAGPTRIPTPGDAMATIPQANTTAETVPTLRSAMSLVCPLTPLL